MWVDSPQLAALSKFSIRSPSFPHALSGNRAPVRASQGLFTIIAARVLASQSRCGNHRLESCVRENRTHGSEGGDGESRFRPLSDFDGIGNQYDSPIRREIDRKKLNGYWIIATHASYHPPG